MARTLKDVYIKVTKQNTEYLSKLVGFKLPINHYLCFLYDLNASLHYYEYEPKDKQKVSLSQLKRLIDTIPTREEITRLKRQISAYKTNLSLVNERCKELRGDNDILVDNMEKLDDKLESAEKENKHLNEMYDDLVVESGKKKNLLKNLYDDALKENDKFKQQKEVTDNIIHGNHDKIKFLNSRIDTLIWDINRVKLENERLKNKKWYQIWK